MKGDIVARLHAALPGHFKKDLDRVADIVFDSIANALKNGERIELRGLGSFVARPQKGREFVNPRNRKTVSCRPGRRIVFRAGKDLTVREDMN